MDGCAALTDINANGNELTTTGLEGFCSLPPPQLTRLDISAQEGHDGELTLTEIPIMDMCGSLVDVDVGSNPLSLDSLVAWCASPPPNLEKLSIADCELAEMPDMS